MARCKLTKMNLRNIRKTREYQCLVIDLVRTGVMTKSAAEGLLDYSIPAGLIDESTSTPTTEPEEPQENEPGTSGETGGDTPVTTRTVAVKAYGMYQPSCGGPQLSHFHDEYYSDVDSLDIEISSNDTVGSIKDKILEAYNTKCGATDVDSSGNQAAGSLAANPATEVTFITDVSESSFWTEMDPQPSDISAFDDMDTIEVILR